MRSALPDRHAFPVFIDRRDLLLGTTALIAWASFPAKAQVSQPVSASGIMAPVIALDPASDFGVSNSDNISNVLSPSLLVTVDSSIPEGAVIEILDNGQTYARHILTAAEIGSGVVDEVAKSRSDGLHNINAAVSINGVASPLSNTLPYRLDTSISTPKLTGVASTTESAPLETVTFGATKPQAGDVLVLIDANNSNAVLKEKILGAGDLASTKIQTPALPPGSHRFGCYVYGSDNRFSPMSNALPQVIRLPNAIRTTFGNQQISNLQSATLTTTGTLIGNGVVVLGFAAGVGGDIGDSRTLVDLTIYVPNKNSPVKTIRNPAALVSQNSAASACEYVAFYTFDNTGSGHTTCDVEATFSKTMGYGSVTSYTMTPTTKIVAYASGGDASTSNGQPLPISAPLSLKVPAGGAAFAIATAWGGAVPPTWIGINGNPKNQAVRAGLVFNLSSVNDDFAGDQALNVRWTAVGNFGGAMCAVSFSP